MRVFSRFVDVLGLRAEFPVLQSRAYLNAGTDGPLPAAAVKASARELEREAADGRAFAHFERRRELNDALRAAYARTLGADSADVALTTCTSDGMATIVAGLELQQGDEILTSDEEHPGLLGALGAARELRGASIREVPMRELASAVGPRTRLVACSHVGWMSGLLAPAELAEVDVPVLLDGAQGVGAVPVDVTALGCDAYAGAGQKWMCGPDGLGMLWVKRELAGQIAVSRRGYANLEGPNDGVEAQLHGDARRFDTMSLSAEAVASGLAAAALLESVGWSAVHERARALAATLVERLGELGREVALRDDTTLVSFASADAEAEREALGASGCIVRNIPGRPWLRASVGAWNDESDLDRLLASLAAA
jgi:selenocysteine lyase/cysteine desulfurase